MSKNRCKSMKYPQGVAGVAKTEELEKTGLIVSGSKK
jgi:hypothetical protein